MTGNEQGNGNYRKWLAATGLFGGILLILTYVLLAIFKGPLPFWGDEAFTARVAHSSWNAFIAEIANDVHPPLYFFIQWIIVSVFKLTSYESGDWRFFRIFEQFMFFTLIWVMAFEVLRVRTSWLKNSTSMALTICLMILSAHHVLFMPMLRYYCLAALLVFITTTHLFPEEKFPQIIKLRPMENRHIRYAIGLWFCLATSYLTVLIIPAHLAFILKMENPYRRNYIKALVVSLICAIPLFILMLYQMNGLDTSGFIGLIPFIKGFIARFAYTIYSFLIGEFIQPWDFWLSIPTLISMIYLILLSFRGKNDDFGKLIKLILLISLPLGILALTIIGIGIEFSASRLTFLAPFFLLLLVQAPFLEGITKKQKKSGIAAIILLLVLNIYSTVNYLSGREYIQSTYIIPWNEISVDILNTDRGSNLILYDDDTFTYWTEFYITPTTPSVNIFTLDPDSDDLFTGRDWVTIVFSPSVISQESIESLIFDHTGIQPVISEQKNYLVEDETSMHWKSMLLGREINEVKKKLIIYNIQG